MINPNLLAESPDAVASALANKGVEPDSVFEARDALVRRRTALAALEGVRAEMNRRSKEIGRIVGSGGTVGEAENRQLAELKARIAEFEAEYREADERSNFLLLRLPNLPSPQAPVGAGEEDNVVVRYAGPDAGKFNPDDYRPHWDVATDLNIFDAKRAAKLSGSGFALLYGGGARLLRALVQFGLDLHRDTYTEVVVPHLVRGPLMTGTGHLPKFADDAYNTTLDDLWLVPTGEVPLTGLHQDEILDPDELPKRYMTHTACFRREAGAAGKDTRGFQRVHEFHKVEMVRICTPATVEDEFEALLADAELGLQKLELPYRVVDLCTGDLTFASARILDLEVYAPGVNRWLEVSSVGNFTDFQARRGNIRYRDSNGKTALANTLNGSAMATPRMWAAIVEHGQRSDGSVEVPDALVPYLGSRVIEPNR